MTRKIFMIVFTSALAGMFAIPADAADTINCFSSYLPDQSGATAPIYWAATVKESKGDHIYFHAVEDGCPGQESCKLSSYVLPGDQLIVTLVKDGWACAYFKAAPESKMIHGWVEAETLDIQSGSTNDIPNAWVGKWESFQNDAHITIMSGSQPSLLHADGEAYYGTGDQQDDGEFSWDAKPEQGVLTLRDAKNDRCLIHLNLVGRYLIADDNNYCGGLNVTFSGVYLRKRPTS